MGVKRKRYGHYLRSKHIPNKVRLIRKFNRFFGWSLPDNTLICKGNRQAGLKTGYWFDFWFIADDSIYGCMESVSNMLKYKEFETFNNGKDIEIFGCQSNKKSTPPRPSCGRNLNRKGWRKLIARYK